MAHGDDDGLVLPPRVAPIQTVVLAVRDDDEVNAACDQLVSALGDAGVRVTKDQGRGSFGRRVTDWEIKGVPLRVEVGPRDLAQGLVTIVRRDSREKLAVSLAEVATTVTRLLETMQTELFDAARRFRDERTRDVTSLEEAVEAAQSGFARLPWDLIGEAGETRLKAEAVTVRCLQRRDGSIPSDESEPDLVAIVAKSY